MTSICVNIWEEKGYKFGNGEKLGVIRCQTRRPLVSRWYIEVICKYLFSFKGIITSAYEKSLISNLYVSILIRLLLLLLDLRLLSNQPRSHVLFPGFGPTRPQASEKALGTRLISNNPQSLSHCKLQNTKPKTSRNSSLVDIYRNDFIEAEYCSLLGKENTSHGYCKRTKWPPPFSWARYIPRGSGLSKVVLMYSGKKKWF